MKIICTVIMVLLPMFMNTLPAYPIKCITDFEGTNRVNDDFALLRRLADRSVSIRLFKGSIMASCMGTLINHQWVVTAAHCVQLIKKEFQGKVFVDGTTYLIKRSEIYPGWDENIQEREADIGLIQLENPIDKKNVSYEIFDPIISNYDGTFYAVGYNQEKYFRMLAYYRNHDVEKIIGKINSIYTSPRNNFEKELFDQWLIQDPKIKNLLYSKAIDCAPKLAIDINNDADFFLEHGDSGGGLFNLNGELIGVATTLLSFVTDFTIPDSANNTAMSHLSSESSLGAWTKITPEIREWIYLITKNVPGANATNLRKKQEVTY